MMIASMIIEPDFFFGGPEVFDSDAFEGFVDALVAVFHGLHGVAGEGDSGADFCEVGGLFVDCYGDVAAVEGDS